MIVFPKETERAVSECVTGEDSSKQVTPEQRPEDERSSSGRGASAGTPRREGGWRPRRTERSQGVKLSKRSGK